MCFFTYNCELKSEVNTEAKHTTCSHTMADTVLFTLC
uniref:Uncharacterized protein n=1 Tax=Anguilla anguilla TaxID=7936 RepID=A0A0E9TMZ3_ANGAN